MKKFNSTLWIMVAVSVALLFSLPVFAGDSATREECTTKVKEAVKIAQEKGLDETYKAINDPKGAFVWKDSYVFAETADQAIVLAHPVKPGLIGQNLLQLKDVNGKAFIAELAQVASSPKGEGWVDYMWPKPGEKDPSPKHTYVLKVPGQNVAMCAGYYD
jgi:cytochrome c